jgi:uncharacterized membrane protein YedE/YeeE
MTSKLGIHFIYGLLGISMGLILSAVGFTDYDELHNMFAFQDTRMLFGFASAVMLISLIYLAMRHLKGMTFEKKHYHPGTIPGSILFGYGWALCGACPSIVFIQIGQGKLAALATLVGIYAGVRAYRAFHAKYCQWDTGTCGA